MYDDDNKGTINIAKNGGSILHLIYVELKGIEPLASSTPRRRSPI
jgi:hypothetical protein